MAKKKRKESGRRRGQGAAERLARHRAWLQANSPAPPVIQYRPGVTEMGAPPGFRTVGMGQGIMAFAEPLRQYVKEDKAGMNVLMRAAMLLWNHAQIGDGNTTEVVQGLRNGLGLTASAAEELRLRMIERYRYLVPKEIQPKNSMFMFIRNEQAVEIKPFPYDELALANAPIPPTASDHALVNRLYDLDEAIEEGAEHDEYGPLLEKVKNEAEQRFREWLVAKGVPENHWRLTQCLHIFLDFIYAYSHEEPMTLLDVPPVGFQEFFEDFLLRKLTAEPQEYVDWLPALKLFYQFLREKEYLDDPAPLVKAIDEIEPRFVNKLVRHFATA